MLNPYDKIDAWCEVAMIVVASVIVGLLVLFGLTLV
jgi:hypothetical protein